VRPGTVDQLRAIRLRNQRIAGTPPATAQAIVSWLGAVQAQEFGPAKWALGLRSNDITEPDVDRELNEGRILRTHILRPTWHFVSAADIRWMLSVSGPRVQAINAHYCKKLGAGARLVARAHKVFERALEGRALTRVELSARLAKERISAAGQMLAHIVMHAELEGLVCSGPRRGKQSTYMLLDERAPRAKVPAREDALAELARRYFTSHGPAKVQDFVWWSGMTVRDTKIALEVLAGDVVAETFDGETYWMAPSKARPSKAMPRGAGVVDLLPIYDEYLIAYRDRRAMVAPAQPGETREHDIFAHYLMIDGQVRGTWRRRDVDDRIEIALTPYRPLTRSQQRAARAAAARMASFTGRPVRLS
jgi:winged helix DNA-binding protein